MRPFIVCHMMESLDGRIDCAMTEKLAGSEEYYSAIKELEIPTVIFGRVTAQMEVTSEPPFSGDAGEPLGKEAVHKAENAEGYTVVADTRGTLGWREGKADGRPLLILLSERVGQNYLRYLESKGISYIATGKERIDLARAAEILYSGFGVQRLGVEGGGTVNAGFLAAGLLDEISIILAPGIDARCGMRASFDGLPPGSEPVRLKLLSAKSFDDGALWLRYSL
ncbi:MAG: dihydrofolate reductase family protein [Succinivibrionaceae bacterium]|nr:dihydrofolate reductase family protein [Succinivibrionaceae bacterium]MDY6374558.1 dihydrofolate reductase family protein [Succinivibrionaceae bacterium]